MIATMDPKYYGVIEMAFTFGVVAFVLVQQFWSLREKPPKDDDSEPPMA